MVAPAAAGQGLGGCLLVAAGIAVFLSLSPSSSDRREVPAGDWILAFAVVAVVTVIAVAASRVTGKTTRARMLAAAAGVIFGLTAAVTASFTRSLRPTGLAASPAGLILRLSAAAAAITGIAVLGPQLAAASDPGHRPHDGRGECDLLKARAETVTTEGRADQL